MKRQLFYSALIGKGAIPTQGYKPAGSLTLEKAVAVYQNGYIARLTETLGDTFESVWQVLGDELFFDVCRQFISQNESQSYNLSDYSVKFIDFLISHPATEEFPFLPDLAHLGWLHKEVFHSTPEKSLMGNELMTALNEDEVSLRLAPTVQILQSKYCLFDMWRALKQEIEVPKEWSKPQQMIFYKWDHQVYVRELSTAEYTFFENMHQGMDILDACLPMAQEQVTSLFQFLGSHPILRV